MTGFVDTITPVAARVVGRRRELESIVAVLAAGRDVILEGPPGTSKTTLLREIASAAALPLEMVEGAPDLLPAKLVGGHDPALVLGQGYQPEAFVEGPLLRAMRGGGMLYCEEFNRIPEDVTNVLIRAMSERRMVVPRMGEFVAAPSFRVVAAMNPYDDAGTERISRAIGDRFCKVRMDYQNEEEERAIVHLRVPDAPERLGTLGVAISRRSRQHPQVRMGASVRGAMDFAAVAAQLLSVRRCSVEALPLELALEAAVLAFSSKIWMAPTAELTVEEVVREIVMGLLAAELPAVERDGGPSDGGQRTTTTVEKTADETRARPLSRSAPPERETSLRLSGQPTSAIAAANSALAAHRRFIALAEGGALPILQPAALADLEAALERAAGMQLDRALFLSRRRGRKGPLRPRRAEAATDELDLDTTLEQWAQGVWGLAVLARAQQPRAFSLMLDISGSMAGPSLISATVMAAILAQHMGQHEHAVVGFAERAITLKGLEARMPASGLLRSLARLRALGTTNISSGLHEGMRALLRSRASERIGILLTDGAHNHTSDPAPVAARFPRLHVIAYRPPWERARVLCKRLAASGRGVCVIVHHLDELPDAIATCLQ